MRAPSNPLALIGPAILVLFAAAFVWIWAKDRRSVHLLFYGAAAFMFCLGALSQILAIPQPVGANAVISALIYTLSVLLLCDGMLRRSGKYLRWLEYAACTMIIVSGIAYFYYVERQLIVRIYLLNFGFGLVCLATAWRLRNLRIGKPPERILFWILLAFSVHFFPRTVFTVGAVAPTADGFASSPFWLALQFSLAVLGAALALALLTVTAADIIENLRRERSLDPLTGLLNRRGFDEIAVGHLQTSRTWPVSLIAIDIDHFKKINDSFGHAAGDAVLKTFSRLLLATARQVDVCGRFGGEEFLVLMPNCDGVGAQAVAERLRTKIRMTAFDGLPVNWRATISIGVTEARRGELLSDLITRADEALYHAKRSGRDRVRVYGEIASV
ncbi:GGDEF domain-containing protein (plasmid) [Sinorhizobium meliloti]|nr:GGDEF domain-containing protein [Sinorhizobium meliloti]ASP76427.1 GGDEF domain-containing protein [Sinorhizobium meliloti]MDE3857032.1 GGDEF domain-containing protein [Sinorhizobium meliloti]MQW49702.1 diguanylate cyclase [Sinorhizobium meliloti]